MFLQDAWKMPSDGANGEELVDAQSSIDSAEASGRMSGKSKWQAFVQVLRFFLDVHLRMPQSRRRTVNFPCQADVAPTPSCRENQYYRISLDHA
jgi:hypothetical protein